MSDGGKIGIITAMETEIWPLVRKWRPVVREYVSLKYRFFENGDAVVLAGGIGHAAGMRAAEAMIAAYSPDLLIAAGLAGGLRPEWAPPRQMIAARVIDEETGREFKTVEGQGTVVSSRTIAGAEKKRELAQRFPAEIVDMEGSAIGEVAANHSLPFLAVKAVSDERDFDLPPLQNYVDPQGQFQTARFTLAAAMRPHWWPMVVALRRKTGDAALHLAVTLRDLIREHGKQGQRVSLTQRS